MVDVRGDVLRPLVLLAGDTSERQSLTRTITHDIKFYILLVL